MKTRSIGTMIILSIITFGLYLIFWSYSFQNNLKDKTGEGFGGLVHLLMHIITFGIYGVYWQYAAGRRLSAQGADDRSLIYLILTFTPLAILNPFLMQSQANDL